MIPKPDLRGRGFRRWHLAGGVSLQVTLWRGVRAALHTLQMPTRDEYGTWGALISRSQAAAILAALGRERSRSRNVR
jgi:hypothetical protein